MGPSGCGKSTLLNIFGLLDNPSDGQYYFLNEEVSKYTERQRANMRKANIGFVFQSFNLIDELTVFENVELPLLYLGVAASQREKMVNEVLEKMQIMHRKDHFPQQLSGTDRKLRFRKWRGSDEYYDEAERRRNDDHHGYSFAARFRIRSQGHPFVRRPCCDGKL